MTLIATDRPENVSIRRACDAIGLNRSGYYRKQQPPKPKELKKARPKPTNALSEEERKEVKTLLNSDEYCDQPPVEVYAQLLGQGIYYCSVSTMYRILRAAQQLGERRNQRPAQHHAIPRLKATRPNEVWTWDITKLPSQQRGVYFNLYVVLDLFSRFIVAWMISRKENSTLSKQLVSEAAARYSIGLGELTLHQDRGAPMTARGYLDLMVELDITCSHSRPRVSNDNPYSESHFKTVKQQPDYPGRFHRVEEARQWFSDYVEWYNYQHHHRGIAWYTPEQVFTGRYQEISIVRQQTLDKAWETHSERFINGRPQVKLPPAEVTINPALPDERDQNLMVNFPTLNYLKGKS
jgi:putative transposase